MLTVNADEHADLFWAIRGGGGNFGVVTAFEYQAHHVPTSSAGSSPTRSRTPPAVIERYREVTADAPDELTAFLASSTPPTDQATKLDRHAAVPLRRRPHRPKPTSSRSAPRHRRRRHRRAGIPYPDINTMLDAGFPAGTYNYWKSAFLRELSADSVGVLVDAFERCPSPMTSIVVAPYHGATSRVSPTATAFPHRGPGYSPVILTQWADPCRHQRQHQLDPQTFDALRPHTTDRVYVNNLSRRRRRWSPPPTGRTGPTRRPQTALRPRQHLPPQPQHQALRASTRPRTRGLPMTQRITEANGVDIWSEDFGDPSAPTILLVMGAGQQAIVWPDQFVDALVAGGKHVIRYDNRDVGQTTCVDFQTNPYTVTDMAADGVAVLDAYGVGQADLVGASMGGMIVQTIALNAPHRVRTIRSIMSRPLARGYLGLGETDLAGFDRKLLDLMARNSEPPTCGEEHMERAVELRARRPARWPHSTPTRCAGSSGASSHAPATSTPPTTTRSPSRCPQTALMTSPELAPPPS